MRPALEVLFEDCYFYFKLLLHDDSHHYLAPQWGMKTTHCSCDECVDVIFLFLSVQQNIYQQTAYYFSVPPGSACFVWVVTVWFLRVVFSDYNNSLRILVNKSARLNWDGMKFTEIVSKPKTFLNTNETISLNFIPTQLNLADLFTGIVKQSLFSKLKMVLLITFKSNLK